MNVRAIKLDDYDKIREIHNKYYENEFKMPDFVSNFLGAFVIEQNEEIISVVSLRKLLEVIAITNKDKSIRDRRLALMSGIQVLSFIAEREGYDKLHAFVQDDNWMKIMINKFKFSPINGQGLVLEI